MKLPLMRAVVLLSITVVPGTLYAQETAGVAKVSPDSYFDASYGDAPFAETSYSSEATFSSNDYGNDSSNDSGSWSDLWDTNDAVESNGGLLGRRYLRAAYITYGVDDSIVEQLDDYFDGFDIEVNIPSPWFNSDDWGSDLFVEYERRSISGVFNNGNAVELDQDIVTIGTRVFAWPQSRFRPYFAAGVDFSNIELAVTPGLGTKTHSTDGDSTFAANVGFELDLATWASFRADVELHRENVFEGLLIFWPHERIFVRGGFAMPLDDGFDAGGTIGGGFTF